MTDIPVAGLKQKLTILNTLCLSQFQLGTSLPGNPRENFLSERISATHGRGAKLTIHMQKFCFLYDYVLYVYPGVLVGNDDFIHQSVTRTVCIYKTFSCSRSEDPKPCIVWRPSSHFFQRFHSLALPDLRGSQHSHPPKVFP